MEEHPQQKEHKRRQQKHYVFGYGSLICPESRAVTAEALRGGNNGKNDDGAEKDDGAIPVRLNHWIRAWNIRGYHTYLGVQQCAYNDEVTKDAASAKARPDDDGETEDSTNSGGARRRQNTPHQSCVGVLVPLPSSDGDDDDESNNAVLEALDRREFAYRRQKVVLGWIERVDDLLLGDDNDDNGGSKEQLRQRKQAIHDKYYKGTFLETERRPGPGEDEARTGTKPEKESGEPGAPDSGDPDAVCVWIYVPLEKYWGVALPEKPILQSYVDICIRGALSISKTFAREFVLGTYGWYTGHSHETSGDDGDEDPNHGTPTAPAGDSSSSSCWINDRNNPIYVRADKDYALKHSESLDAVFDPLLLRWRGPMGQNP